MLLFNREGDCLAAKLRPGNVHSADDWEELLLPEMDQTMALWLILNEIWKSKMEIPIKYFRLAPVKRSDQLRATMVATDDDFEVSECPIMSHTSFWDPDFHWDGQRLRNDPVVSVKHGRRDELLIWMWGFGILVHEQLIAEFEALRLTGYRLRPATVRFRFGRISTEYRELVVVGWAGMAPAESGIQMTRHCPSCHWAKYSGLLHPKKLIDWSCYTGEDFFVVWPLGYSHILVTERVAGLLQKLKVKSYSLERPNKTWGAMFGFGGGRLSSWMPDDLARKYGEPLGLESGTPAWIPRSEAFKSQATRAGRDVTRES